MDAVTSPGLALEGQDTIPAAAALVSGVFLHAGWRSCGTWLWERLRESTRVQAFYEPFHEDLATLRASDIGLLRPDSWQSGHGTGAPYFTEYAPFLGPRGGVRGHAARFAFDNYFRPPEEDDAELQHYLRGLIGTAKDAGRLPVLKFCRSLGRVSWLEAHFPDMLHAVVLRDPQAQWRSARRQMEHNGNRYFVVAPFVILARNAENPLLAEAANRLAVRLPPGLGRSLTGNLSVTTDACWRHVSKLDWRDRFRGFLTIWIASNIAALGGAAALIDADGLARDAQARGAAETLLGGASGLDVDLMASEAPESCPPLECDTERQDAADAAGEALGFLHDNSAGLTEERAAILAMKLSDLAAQARGMSFRGAHPPGPMAYVDAAAYIAIMRASYPLRRAHFHLQHWMNRDASRTRCRSGSGDPAS